MVLNKRGLTGVMKARTVLFTLLLVLLSSIALADITLDNPAANFDAITGSAYLMNATNTSCPSDGCFNVSMGWINGSTYVESCFDDSPSGNSWSCEADTTIVCDDGSGDCTSLTFSARLLNTTNVLHNDTNNTGVNVDNTNPTALLNIVGPTTIHKSNTISYYCGDSTDNQDTSLSYNATLNDSQSVLRAEILDISGTFPSSNVNLLTQPDKLYNVRCEVADNANNTAAVEANVTVLGRDDDVVLVTQVLSTGKNRNIVIIAAGIMVIVGIAAVLFLMGMAGGRSRRKRRRR